MSGGFEIAVWVLLGSALVTDLLWGKIYNYVTFPFLLIGLISRFSLGGWDAGRESLWAVAAAMAIYFPLYLIRTLAAGDVKLLMAFGAWSTPQAVIQVGIFSILIGAVVGAFLMWRQKGLKDSAQSLLEHVRTSRPRTSMRIPFAPGMLCAFLVFRIAELRQWQLFFNF